MSTIFPGSASVGQIYNNYTFDGTAWNINGIDLTENYLEESSASATYQPLVANVSNTEIGYLDGVTSGIQSQIDSKLSTISASSTYLTQTSASTTYLTQVSASSTYVSKTTIPAFRLYQSTPQTITTATNTALLFDSEDLDTDNGHSTVTNTSRYTATVAGWYMVTGTLQIAHNTTGNRIVFIRKNGSTTINQVGRQTSSATNTLGLQIGTMVYLNGTTDYLELMAFQSSGGNLDTLTANPSYFEGFWVRS